MDLKKSSHRRFQSDADVEDVEVQNHAGKTGTGRAGRPIGSAAASSSTWFGAPMMLGVMAFFAVMTMLHVYQFSLSPMHLVLTEPFYNKTMVEFTTKFGKFTVELYPDHAPNTVETFKKLVDQGFYTGDSGFYRNEPKFVLQGGGFLYDKVSPFGNLPVEYSLPSTERMVVLARSKKADSGSTEFAIMLHDNTESNEPTEDSPGYTAFGRVVAGWHTIEFISKKMGTGYLSKDDKDRQINFEKVEFVSRITNDNIEAKKRIEELTYVLETPYTVVIISDLDCPEKKQLDRIFAQTRTSVRILEAGYSDSHPFELEAIDALTGQSNLPLVFIDGKYVGGLEEVQRLEKINQLKPILEKAGTLAEQTVWTAINKYPLVLFSKSFCPYCKKTKETLTAVGANPVVFELDLREDGAAMQAFLFRLTGQSTVPNVFIKGKSIGGNDDTQALYKSGELDKKLQKAGAI